MKDNASIFYFTSLTTQTTLNFHLSLGTILDKCWIDPAESLSAKTGRHALYFVFFLWRCFFFCFCYLLFFIFLSSSWHSKKFVKTLAKHEIKKLILQRSYMTRNSVFTKIVWNSHLSIHTIAFRNQQNSKPWGSRKI